MALMSYDACWANPLWSQWDVPLSSEQDQILWLLRRALLDVPTSQRLRLDIGRVWKIKVLPIMRLYPLGGAC